MSLTACPTNLYTLAFTLAHANTHSGKAGQKVRNMPTELPCRYVLKNLFCVGNDLCTKAIEVVCLYNDYSRRGSSALAKALQSFIPRPLHRQVVRVRERFSSCEGRDSDNIFKMRNIPIIMFPCRTVSLQAHKYQGQLSHLPSQFSQRQGRHWRRRQRRWRRRRGQRW